MARGRKISDREARLARIQARRARMVAVTSPEKLRLWRGKPLPSTLPTGNRPPRPAPRPSLWRWAVRLAIAAVGLSVLVGTGLSFWQTYRQVQAKAAQEKLAAARKAALRLSVADLAKNERLDLKAKIQALAAAEPDLQLHLYWLDLDNGDYVDINGQQPVPGASTIKLPILLAFCEALDRGQVRLSDPLEITEDVRAGEAGDLQFQPNGTKFSALVVMTKTIAISDNLGTNLIIKRLGGMAALNRAFQAWELKHTVLRNPLPDVPGQNTVSPYELVTVLARIEAGVGLSRRSRDRALDILRQTENDTLIVQGLPPQARVAHKTGAIAKVVGDAALVDRHDGRRYFLALLVQRPHNEDNRAEVLIQNISKLIYETPPLPPSAGNP